MPNGPLPNLNPPNLTRANIRTSPKRREQGNLTHSVGKKRRVAAHAVGFELERGISSLLGILGRRPPAIDLRATCRRQDPWRLPRPRQLHAVVAVGSYASAALAPRRVRSTLLVTALT
jgi:hypothetical protein